MAYRVTKIVYASHPNTLQAGGVPHQQTLLIFGVEGTGSEVLLWQGYRVPITPSEWEGSTSGGVTTKSWGGSFTKGYGATAPDQLKNLSPVDTSTASVSANISYASNSTIGYVLAFTYAAPGAEESEEYTVYLGNYVNSEIRLCTPRTEGGTQIYQTYDFVPAEVGISSNGEAESSAEYGTTASYRRAVVNEWVMLESFDVQLTGTKQFTATYSGRCYLDPNVHSSFNAISFRLYVTELDANGDAAETGSYGLPVTASNGNTEFSGSLVLTDIANQLGYDLATKYKFYVVASIDAEEAATSAEIQRWTQRRLPAPTVTGVSALDGVGSVSWGSVENAAGYEIAVVDSASADPVSGTSAASPWNFNEATSGTTVQGKYVRIHALAVANQYEWGTSEWSAGTLIPNNRTPEEEEPSTPVEINMTRRIYKAIPFIDVPVEQIGANGSSPKDVITVEYADAHYVQSGGEIPASQIPFAVYGDTDDDSETTVVNPAYVKGAIDDINQVYAITDIQIASNDTTKFAGVATSVTNTAENYTLITRKGVYDFASNASNLSSGTVANARLNKAKSGGGADNAGIVYISNAQGQNGLGLKIDTTNDGLLSVNFATYGTDATTVTTKAVHPKYVADAIAALSLGTAATKNTGTGSGNVPILDQNGKLDTTVIPDLAITDITTKTDKVRYGTGQTYTDRAAAIAAKLPTTGIQKGDVYIYAPSLSDAEQAEGGYLVGTFIYTGSAWQEMYTPVDGVITVNGKYGPNVNLTASDVSAIPSSYLETTLTANSDVKVPSSKAVATYVTGRGYQTASQVSTSISGAGATWTTGTSAWSDTGTGYVSVTYLQNALNNYDSDVMTTVQGMLDSQTHVSADITDSISAGTGITSNAAGLVQGKAVYAYAAPADHKHGLGDITYSGSGTSRVGYAAGTTISASSTAGQLATAKAVYDYIPPITRVYATGTTKFAGVTTNLATTISSENYSIPTAYAVQQALAGKAASSHKHGLGDITYSGTTGYSAGTTISTTQANNNDGQLATTLAVYKFVSTNYAAKTHTHTSSQISDAISTVSDPSATSTFGKVVKTESAWGQIGAKLVPIDENSLEFYTSGGNTVIQISDSYVNSLITQKGYLTATNAANTYARKDSMFPTWTAGTSYAVGDVVWYSNTLWKCHTANTASSSANNSNAPSGNASDEWYTNCWTSVNLNDLFGWAGRYTGTITGDGTTTSFDVTHNLGVTDVDVTLIDNNTGQEVYAAVTMVSSSVVRIGFGAAPESGKVYRVVVRK